jgi:lambda family phage portal protein
VPAQELYHLYLSERTEQTIGVPWVVSAITRLRQLGAFEEAATIAARLGASKAGFFEHSPGPNGEMGEFTGATTASGNPVMDAAPGTFEALPAGWKLTAWQPEYPNITTGDFRKAMLRGVATSLGMSYTTLGNDLESVNFSSARVGLFEEREWWKALQTWYTENLWEPIFADWLEAAISTRVLNLPMSKFAKFNRPIFKSRRWPFIDPAKEISAAREAVALRISSRQQVIEEAGGDRDDVFLDNLSDEEYAAEIGLTLQPPDVMPEKSVAVVDNPDNNKGPKVPEIEE